MAGHFISTSSSDPFASTSTVKMSRPTSLASPSSASKPTTPTSAPATPSPHVGTVKSVVCPFCYTQIKAKVGHPCPNESCYSHRRGIPLPDEVFTHELFSIAIVGPASSGKSHYLAALKHSLVDEAFWGRGDKRGGYWNWSFVTYYNPDNADNQSVDNPYIRYEENLYGDGVHITLDSTKRDDEHPPLLLSLKYLHPISRMFDEPRFRKKSLLVAITDTAGEHSHRESAGALEDNYPVLKKLIRGFIVMLSPKAELCSSEAANVVLSWIKGSSDKVDLPIALCLSKIDELSHEEGPKGWAWLNAEKYNTDLSVSGRLRLHDIKNHSLDISGWMKRNALRSTALNVESSFKYHAFFASSALGRDPFQTDPSTGLPLHDSAGAMKLKGVPSPLRVLDPLLWILWQHGKLGGLDKISTRMNGDAT